MILSWLNCEETAPSETEDAAGFEFDAQNLYDRGYHGDSEFYNPYDVELFSEDAIIAEGEYIEQRNEEYVQNRISFLTTPKEEKTIDEYIREDLGGASLFGNDTFKTQAEASRNSKLSSNALIVVLCVIGVVIGVGGAFIYRRFIKRGVEIE